MKNAKKWTVAAAALLVTVAVAQSVQRSLTLTINGQRAALPAIVVNGRSYVAVESLRAVGVTASQTGAALALTVPTGSGGANQVTGLSGCVNQQLFNGVWRLRVTRVAAVTNGERRGTALTIEMRNGTNRTQTLAGTGAGGPLYQLENFQLATQDGATIGPSGSILDFQATATRDVPQGAPLTFTLNFFPTAESTPNRLVARVDRANGANYTVPDPSFRVDLTCTR